MNYASPVVADDAVREAIAMGIDKESFVNVLLNGYGYVATGAFPDTVDFGGSTPVSYTHLQMSDSYFLLSGGAGTNVMHEQRAEGMLDALQEAYGVQFEQSSAELASASEPVSVEAGNLKVTVFPGYIGVPDVGEKAVAEFEKDPAGVRCV